MAAAGMATPRDRRNDRLATPQDSKHYHVPQYDLAGGHHRGKPYKDMSHIKGAEINHPKWLEPRPDIATRAELMQARKRARVPDGSYDFDGDGAVGQLDHFIGRCFDGDNDGRLTTGERRQAEQALQSGFLDKYMRGIDQTHPSQRNYTVKQVRGAIMVSGDARALAYPKHFNADNVPSNPTRTHLQQARLAEAKAGGHKVGEKLAEEFAPVLENHPPTHKSHPRTCAISNIRDRAEADHQAARVAGGLLPMGTGVNPERESKTLSLDHVYRPEIVTRGQLLETRKEEMKKQGEELRQLGDAMNVPYAVQKIQKESKLFEFRRPEGHEPMTLTVLKDKRKQDGIEHNMHNFQYPSQPQFPRFSDNPDVPFWLAGQDAAATAPVQTAPIPRSYSEPALKVNHVPFAHTARNDNHALPEAAHRVAEAAGRINGQEVHFGSNTKKRYSTEYHEGGAGRNKPRIFDDIQPLRVGPRDLEELDLTSSMEYIRNAALRRRNQAQVAARFAPRTSQLCTDPNRSTMSMSMPTRFASPSKDSSMDWAHQVTDHSQHQVNMTRMNPGGSRFGGPVQKLTTSDPAMRTVGQQAMERALANSGPQPKIFHSSQTVPAPGVRCGGFHALESMQAGSGAMRTEARSKSHSRAQVA
jgi:hypothetical protein